jgi:hypothetical protein
VALEKTVYSQSIVHTIAYRQRICSALLTVLIASKGLTLMFASYSKWRVKSRHHQKTLNTSRAARGIILSSHYRDPGSFVI